MSGSGVDLLTLPVTLRMLSVGLRRFKHSSSMPGTYHLACSVSNPLRFQPSQLPQMLSSLR